MLGSEPRQWQGQGRQGQGQVQGQGQFQDEGQGQRLGQGKGQGQGQSKIMSRSWRSLGYCNHKFKLFLQYVKLLHKIKLLTQILS